MKKVKLFLWVAILCTSCSTSKILTSDVKPYEITEMLKIGPFSYISLIEKGNQGIFNDSISDFTEILLNESLESFRGKLRLSSEGIILEDELELEKLEEEISMMIMAADRSKSVHNIPITPFLDSIMSVSNKRFGLIVIQNGFTRSKGNYGGQVAKSIGLGILTGLLTGRAYYQQPVKSHSTLYAMIIDNRNKNVAFYNKSVVQDSDPTKKENITKQINKVFEKYFWDKK